MFSSKQVMPFPGLATKESESANNRPEYPFHNTAPVTFMTSMYCQHHGNRADDEDKGHKTHESQGKILVPGTRESIEDRVRIRPEILAETDTTVRDQECTECKGIAHQEIPHHQFTIL